MHMHVICFTTSFPLPSRLSNDSCNGSSLLESRVDERVRLYHARSTSCANLIFHAQASPYEGDRGLGAACSAWVSTPGDALSVASVARNCQPAQGDRRKPEGNFFSKERNDVLRRSERDTERREEEEEEERKHGSNVCFRERMSRALGYCAWMKEACGLAYHNRKQRWCEIKKKPWQPMPSDIGCLLAYAPSCLFNQDEGYNRLLPHVLQRQEVAEKPHKPGDLFIFLEKL